ncbi:hypothetical protein XENOCAPTIV_020695, partial [Xenoophorus captivus]
DLRSQLYESYYLNFISAISRSKLEDIASAALTANAVSQVTKVTLGISIFLCRVQFIVVHSFGRHNEHFNRSE